MKVKIRNAELARAMDIPESEFEKYVPSILNLANRISQATRPKNVGNMTDLTQEFGSGSFEEWKEWYSRRFPDSISQASERIRDTLDKIRTAMENISDDDIALWVEDLVLAKTYFGLCIQEAILKKVAAVESMSLRIASAQEESQGIDGHIGDVPVSVKPHTYRKETQLLDELPDAVIFYTKKSGYVLLEWDSSKLQGQG